MVSTEGEWRARRTGGKRYGRTVEALGRRILTGELAEGATLDLAALEVELGVSRTVVREALRVLAAKGLVEARQKRGTVVTSRPEWNLLDSDILRWQFDGQADPTFFDQLNDVRRIVEPAGARMAAARRTEQDLTELTTALQEMVDAGDDVSAATRADLAFHRALLVATHNELLVRMEVVIEAGLAERDRLVHGSGDAGDPVPSHQPVYDAVRRRQPAQAERAMRALLDRAVADVELLRPPAADGREEA